MINQQLVEYIKSQFTLGASNDSVKGALIGAGWDVVDVEDSIKSVEASGGLRGPSPKPAPTTISVSDLIPNSNLDVVSTVADGGKGVVLSGDKKIAQKPAIAEKAEKPIVAMAPKSRKAMVAIILLAVLALGSAAGATYLYFQNKSLRGKSGAATTLGDAASSKIADLNSQITELTKARDDLTAQVSTLKPLADEGAALKTNLSFFVVPPGSAASATATATVKGVLSGGGKLPYIITTPDGLKVSVKNYKDAKVDEVLKPLLGATAEISGTHVLGSSEITVTSVNGVPVQ